MSTPSKSHPWIHCWSDSLAGVFCHSGCIRLADMDDDGDQKLILLDTRKNKIRIYKGTSMIFEAPIGDSAVCMEVYYGLVKKPCMPLSRFSVYSNCHGIKNHAVLSI
jgi:hypothetical protein